MEELELADPIVVPEKVATTYKVVEMLTSREVVTPTTGEPGLVTIMLRDNLGTPVHCRYEGTEAIELIKWMNTANFSVNSMQKRVMQKLSADGQLPPGTVVGAPDPAA